MIFSMTGYGSHTFSLGNKNISIELRSLNSKSFDLNLRIPYSLKPYEIELRNVLAEKLVRGKVDCTIKTDELVGDDNAQINKTLLIAYVKELRLIAEQEAIATPDILAIAMRMPNVIDTEVEVLAENEWKKMKPEIVTGTLLMIGFRKDEGQKLQDELEKRVDLILQMLQHIEANESKRIDTIKSRILEQLNSIQQAASFDASRLEQEMIYYLEKLDVTEEIVRLKTHCNYFLEITHNQEVEKGKKLGFIAQEMGREINTIGSKANDAGMQKHVVNMKDELEKIKEQLNNVL